MPDIVVVFGASGNVGKAVVRELRKREYIVRAVVRSEKRGETLAGIAHDVVMNDCTDAESLRNVLQGADYVISSLGKSVSVNDTSKPTFRDVDYTLNVNILTAAKHAGVKKFVYVSAFHAEEFAHLEYFKVHADVTARIVESGIGYCIVKPPAVFSAFWDVVDLANKGRLMNIGKGDKQTNPICETDVAVLCADALVKNATVIEAGGNTVYTRKEINQLAARVAGKPTNLLGVPLWVVKGMVPLLKPFNKNMYDKLAFFVAVMEEDLLAPRVGMITLEEYFGLTK
ncbi:MAG: NAD(P)H-binding protein [Candidatus Kapaibacterium sp.]|nr:NAD(P)H-binding protein [Bacteroidota bacterium]